MANFSGTDLTCIRGERVVFAGLSFEVSAGGALVLIGPNGSGKSSLLRLAAGLLRPAAGRLDWDGEPVAEDREAHRGRLHYVGHLDAVKPVLTVAENVAFWARLGGGDDNSTAAALDAFAIGHLADLPGRYLSAGQKRRVNLARIVAAPGTLWLLDEPTTALDRASIAALRELVARHRSEGGMVMVSTHADLGIDDAGVLDIGVFAAKAGSASWGEL